MLLRGEGVMGGEMEWRKGLGVKRGLWWAGGGAGRLDGRLVGSPPGTAGCGGLSGIGIFNPGAPGYILWNAGKAYGEALSCRPLALILLCCPWWNMKAADVIDDVMAARGCWVRYGWGAMLWWGGLGEVVSLGLLWWDVEVIGLAQLSLSDEGVLHRIPLSGESGSIVLPSLLLFSASTGRINVNQRYTSIIDRKNEYVRSYTCTHLDVHVGPLCIYYLGAA